MVDFIGVAVGVDDREDLNAHALGLGDADVFPADVDHEDGFGHFGHVPHAGEILLQAGQRIAELHALFLGEYSEVALVPLLLKFEHVIDAGPNGLEIGHGAAQPALVDVQHATSLGFALDHFLGLAFGAHEQDLATLGHKVNHLLVDVVDHAQGLLQVDDVDAVSLGEDVLLHRRVPPPGLMPEVDSRLEKGFHGEVFAHRGGGRCGGCRCGFWRWGRIWFGGDGRGRGSLRFLGNFRYRLFREV